MRVLPKRLYKSPRQKIGVKAKEEMVRTEGLEPPILSEPDPKSGASAIPPRAQAPANMPDERGFRNDAIVIASAGRRAYATNMTTNKKMTQRSFVLELPIRSGAGTFVARYSERGLSNLRFPRQKTSGGVSGRNVQQSIPSRVRAWHRKATQALLRALAGKDPGPLPPMDPNVGTEFQRKVWSALREIQSGTTATYSEIARVVGRPKALRAVGSACGANPIPILIPCHRVLTANLRLGGFSGGLEWKRKLLAVEGIHAKL
jgi:O-6-methylguanine DNA methyltransferase